MSIARLVVVERVTADHMARAVANLPAEFFVSPPQAVLILE